MKRFSLSSYFPWSVLFFLTALFVYIYSFIEWVFFVTKPSFMSGMSLWIQIDIYLLSAFGLSILPLSIICLLGGLDRIFSNKYVTQFLTAVGISIPSLIVSSLILLVVDNFTYTVFKFGIVSTEHILRALYGFLFMVILGFAFIKIKRYVQARSKKKYPVRRNQWIALFIFLSLSVLLSVFSIFTGRTSMFTYAKISQKKDLPSIILLGSDGLDATHLSAYGYERATTPYIKSMLSNALVAENNFPNGGTTAGSVASILTGKLPIETRVIYPPDILEGENSYEHLPGILKRLGYRTVDLSAPYFGDALTLNMQGGFDIANERSGADNVVVKMTRMLGGGDSAYFVDTMFHRISDRLLHIFLIKLMVNPFEAVIKPVGPLEEQKQFHRLISALEDAQTPIFIHVHMLGTHGPQFDPRKQVFSKDRTQTEDWMPDFYDDAILDFDKYVGKLFDYLSDSGKLKNTIVIIYSDHGMGWTIHKRVPLIFWFPDRQYAGKIQANVQNIDIAPTILDYLGVSIPASMRGQSLLKKEITAPQYIFSASVNSDLVEVLNGIWSVDSQKRTPPFYQLGYVGLIACDQWFELYLQSPHMIYGKVKGYTYSCDSGRFLTPEQAQHILLEHLSQNGFDISTFPSSVPMQYAE